jgi:hypothetical protein
MFPVTQIGSGSTWPPVVRERRWQVAGRMGRSCGAMRPALSAELFLISGGFPPSCRDALHPLDKVVGFGQVGLRLFAGAGDGIQGHRGFCRGR